MTRTSYTVTKDGFIPDEATKKLINYQSADGFKIGWHDRTRCPEAYLLNDKEGVLVERARKAIGVVIEKYKKIPSIDYTPEFVSRVALECLDEFKTKRLSVKKLRAVVDKVTYSQYWTIELTHVALNTSGLVGSFTFKTSNPEVYPDIDMTTESHPAFFEGDTPIDSARTLGLPEIYYYIAPTDLDILNTLRYLFTFLDQEKPKPETEPFIKVISSSQLNALHSIGDNVRKVTEDNVKKERDTHGKQIDITEYLTNNGVKVQFANFNPFKLNGDRDISVGSPNADKLLLQAQIECIRTQKQAFEIPLTDFMTFRGLSDRKSALEQAKQACETLLSAKYSLILENEKQGIYGGIGYVQECWVVKSSNKGGNRIYINLTDKLYNHIIEYSSNGRQIEQLDKRVAMIPNNQATAYNIIRAFSTHLRANVTGSTSHRLSVKNLLTYCSSLPLYPYQDSDVGKPNYLKDRWRAPEKIITPFTKALEWLVDNKYLQEYTFTHPKGKPLTEVELKQVYDDYNLFIALNVDVVFENEPDYTNLIEKKSRREAKPKKTKNKG